MNFDKTQNTMFNFFKSKENVKFKEMFTLLKYDDGMPVSSFRVRGLEFGSGQKCLWPVSNQDPLLSPFQVRI